ncbi:MAG TPA: ATP-binding protein, partial [Candidatus Ozemobacteraceae bacterium]|nr:ATP-binding protein [Candidatus Ozemobacteraceae bacterium]
IRLAGELEIRDDRARAAFAEDLRQLTEFLDRTLLAYRVGSHQATFEFVALDLATCLEPLIQDVFGPLGEREKLVTTRVQAVTWSVDRTFFSMLLTNLLTNARKYGTEIEVVLEPLDTGFLLRVKNRVTTALQPSDLPLLSQPFFRPDQSRQPGTSGSGLGLFIARQIAEAHRFSFDLSLEAEIFSVTIRA